MVSLRVWQDTQETRAFREERNDETTLLPVDPEEHLGLARLCARRFCGRGLEEEELLREATVALVAAAARFDPARGVKFSTYAVPCVLSELKRACDKAAPLHVPRTDRALLRQVAALRQEEILRTGQEPTVDELACTLKLPAAELSAALTADFHMQALRAPKEADEAARETETAADQDSARFVDELLLKDVIDRLPYPLAQIIRLRFWEGHTQGHTAEQLGFSQAQICKLEKKAKEALRESLLT